MNYLLNIDKEALIAQMLEDLKGRLAALYQSARAAYEGATHEESRAEDKYDTRGLEASYLAGAQAKRTGELEDAIARYRNLKARIFEDDDPIALTALVQLEVDGIESLYFIGPEIGGTKLVQEGENITVITPKAPLGKKLVGSRADDEFNLTIGGVKRSCLIISVA
ncbi:MAG: transcription elongation factor GreAB [bacterium]|nr:transcription elongation factor GreAB [bacterium]